jgi:hypothetical protein
MRGVADDREACEPEDSKDSEDSEDSENFEHGDDTG